MGKYGVVIASGISMSDYVQSLISESSLSFEPPTPDTATTLRLLLQPLAPRSKEMHACALVTAAAEGDWFAMLLPGFQYFGDNANVVVPGGTPAVLGLDGQLALQFDVISVPSGVVNKAYWFNASKVIYMPVSASVEEGNVVLLQLLATSGLRTPSAGLLANEENLQIMGDFASAGLIPAVAMTSTQAIQPFGTVLFSSIKFNPPSRTETVQLILSFTLSIPILAGEVVTFSLEGFSMDRHASGVRTIAVASEPATCFENPSRCVGKVLQATWDASSQSIDLRLSRDLPAQEQTTVYITKDIGFRVPQQGLTELEETLTVSVNTPNGIIPATAVQYPQPIGFFLQMPQLSYNPAAGSRPTEMKISFQSNTVFERHEVISLYLASFASTYYHTGHIVNVEPFCKLGKALWRNGHLKITLGHGIPLAEKAQIVIPAFVGLQLPQLGIPESISTAQYNSSIQGITGSLLSQSFGAIWGVRMCLPDARSGAPGAVTIAFNMSMALSLTNLVQVYLPGFTGKTSRSLRATMFAAAQEGCNPSGKFTFSPPPIGAWDAATSMMSFTITRSIAAYQLIHLTLEAGGLQISPRGLATNYKGFHVTVRSIEAIMSVATPIEGVPGVGVFEDTAMCFSPVRAGRPAEIAVQFRLRSTIEVGEEVSLELPGFFSSCSAPDPRDCPPPAAWAHFNTSGADASLFARGQWFPLSVPPVLKLYASRPVTPGRLVNVAVPESVGIRLPIQGMPQDWYLLSLATNASSGPVIPVRPRTSCPVGSLNGTEALTFLHPVAGEVSALSFSFKSVWDIEAGAKLRIYLVGMLLSGVSSSATVMVGVEHATGLVSSAVWRGADQSFEFQLTYRVAGGEFVEIVVPSSVGLRIPTEGVKRNQASLSWLLASSVSPVEKRAIVATRGVGVFLASSLTFTPAVAAFVAPVALHIAFSLSDAILSGEEVYVALPGFTKNSSRTCDECARPAERVACRCFCFVSPGVADMLATPVTNLLEATGVFTNGTWSERHETLTLVARAALPGGSLVSLVVGASERFWLPLEGVTAGSNKEALTLATNAILAPVLPIAIKAAAVVGSFKVYPNP